MLADRFHAAGDFVQLVHDRHQPADAEVELLDESDDLIAAGDQASPGMTLFVGTVAAC